ncbi:MAG: hypothetical protein NXH95_15925 [Pseudomonadaceae bacterium]|nr:hypothetical protein [Pseudomonadaceae bacterium]
MNTDNSVSINDRRALDIDSSDLYKLSIEDLKDYAGTIRSRYRDDGFLDDASRENLKLLTLYHEKLDDEITHRDIDMLEYEQGFVEFMSGNFDASTKHFQRSAKHAQLGANSVGVEVANFRCTHNAVFSRELDFEKAKSLMTEHLAKMEHLSKEFPENGLAKSFVYNIKGRLFETSIELGDYEDALRRYSQVREDETTQAGLNAKDKHKVAAVENKLGSMQACLSMVSGQHSKALGQFAEFLEVEVLEAWGPTDKFRASLVHKTQESARDFLFAGSCLLELAKKEAAVQVFSAGLDLETQRTNLFYQHRIREQLEVLEH